MARTITVSAQTIKQLVAQVARLSEEIFSLRQEITRMIGASPNTSLPLVQKVLKDPPYPEERVLLLFSGWKRARSGFIKQTGQGYNFRDGKGNTRQCSPSVDPQKVWIERTNEEWSCCEKKEGEHTPGFSATIQALDEVINFLAKANDKRRKRKKKD